MTQMLEGRKVAFLVSDAFERSELTDPRAALEAAGAEVHVVAPTGGTVRAWEHDRWGGEFAVDRTLGEVDAAHYDALVLPGGVMNPDSLRTDPAAVGFVRAFFERDRPVAAICHAPWLLIEADVVLGRRLTSYPSLRTDLENAGARWVDEAVVVDDGLVTSRRPADLETFSRATIELIAAAVAAGPAVD